MKRPPSILFDPWLISESGASLVWSFWERDFARLADGRDGPFINVGGDYTVVDGVAVVKVVGPIVRHGGLIAEASGSTSDDQIRAGLMRSTADQAVKATVLHFDSPGGEARGAAETADAIRAASKAKPVIAYVAGQASSKAYWFASAADRIVATRDAEVGSIGVRVSLMDASGADQQEGVKRIEIVSDVSPNKRATPVDDAVIADAQRRANEIAAVFVADVARGRKTTVENVVANFGAGGVKIASSALEAGMVDQIGNLSDALALAKSVATQRSQRMDQQPDLNGAHSAAVGFRDAVLTALGTDNEAIALARLTDGITARKELDAVRSASLREKFTAAIAAGKLELGELARVVPHLYAERRAEARTAVAGVAKQEAGEIVAALCSVPVSADAWNAINAYLDEKQPKRVAIKQAVEPADVAKVAEPDQESIDFANEIYRKRFGARTGKGA